MMNYNTDSMNFTDKIQTPEGDADLASRSLGQRRALPTLTHGNNRHIMSQGVLAHSQNPG